MPATVAFDIAGDPPPGASAFFFFVTFFGLGSLGSLFVASTTGFAGRVLLGVGEGFGFGFGFATFGFVGVVVFIDEEVEEVGGAVAGSGLLDIVGEPELEVADVDTGGGRVEFDSADDCTNEVLVPLYCRGNVPSLPVPHLLQASLGCCRRQGC